MDIAIGSNSGVYCLSVNCVNCVYNRRKFPGKHRWFSSQKYLKAMCHEHTHAEHNHHSKRIHSNGRKVGIRYITTCRLERRKFPRPYTVSTMKQDTALHVDNWLHIVQTKIPATSPWGQLAFSVDCFEPLLAIHFLAGRSNIDRNRLWIPRASKLRSCSLVWTWNLRGTTTQYHQVSCVSEVLLTGSTTCRHLQHSIPFVKFPSSKFEELLRMISSIACGHLSMFCRFPVVLED